MPGYQYVGGVIYELNREGTVPVPQQESGEIGSSALPAATAVAPVPRAAAPAPAKAPSAPPNILGLARQRLAEIKRELRRLKQLEREAAELARLISAAKDKRPKVVPLRGGKTA